MTLPRDILTGKMPRVYDTILSLGGVLIPMQQDLDGNVPAYYPDGSTLACTPTPGVDFDHDGRIPRVAGGSPRATFDGTSGIITAPVLAGDALNMSHGGTWLCLCTAETFPEYENVLMWKSTSTTDVRQGYQCHLRASGSLGFYSSGGPNGAASIATASGVFTLGETFLYTATLLNGVCRLFKNGIELKAGTGGMLNPTNIASPLEFGRTGKLLAGSEEWAAMLDGVVLDTPQIQAIAAQCGRLG